MVKFIFLYHFRFLQMHLHIEDLFDIYFLVWKKMYNFAFGLSCLYFNFKSRIVLVKKTETAHAVWSMVKSKDKTMQNGLGWDDNPRHIEGVYLTLCS